ncbi:MAG: 2-C-methyl-D-erythritol 4-phosphate cytidylyltransferase [Desulfobacteraceae bacterium]|nr:2-C-methyl-D-erythritol 4-phosphate cytidylyltransferase [Desulfobacteraceae bacterium]
MIEKQDVNYSERIAAIIPAAGTGLRMGGEQAKQFLEIEGRPLLAVTLQPFQDCRAVNAIILVVPSEDVEYCEKEIIEQFRLNKVIKVVPGGVRRQDSVRLGIEATGGEYGLVLIHDGVRPLVDVELIARVIKEAKAHRAVITAIPAKETVKEIDSFDQVVKTYDRGNVWLVQTPQIFRYKDIVMAHKNALNEGWEEATDDSILIERLGIPVKAMKGSERNIKVTTQYDLALARFLVSQRPLI